MGSLAMFDRIIFKGYLSRLYKQDAARCFLWSQGVALKDFTPYEGDDKRIANNARRLATEAGRPVISFDQSRPASAASTVVLGGRLDHVILPTIRVSSGC